MTQFCTLTSLTCSRKALNRTAGKARAAAIGHRRVRRRGLGGS